MNTTDGASSQQIIHVSSSNKSDLETLQLDNFDVDNSQLKNDKLDMLQVKYLS